MNKAGLYITAAISLLIAVRADEEAVKIAAISVSAGCTSCVTTLRLLEWEQERKRRQAITNAYTDNFNLIQSIDRQAAHQDRQSNRPVACRGCQHYHGQSYGGNLFICGMHPYGVESDTCPDWEAQAQADPQRRHY